MEAQTLLVLTGPESSGKSSLASWLAQHLQAPLVAEVARGYLAAKPTPEYGPNDLQSIATQQSQAELRALSGGAPVVVADTDQQILRLWWAEKYPNIRNAVESQLPRDANTLRRVYLLCYPDLAWEPDPLRENPHDRMRLFRLQLRALEQENAEFRVVWGEGQIRHNRALHYVREVLDQSFGS